MVKDINKINEILSRGVEVVLPNKEALAKLMSEKQITLYQGFDPSMPSLHLGNLVGIIKLSQFQKLGHKVIFLVGDFTGMIGDPTDKKATRKKLSRQEIADNIKSWKEQASKVLDFTGSNKAEFMFNSKWLDKLTFYELIDVSSNFTVQQMLERDMYQERLKKNAPIYLHEFLYPVAQAYDSVSLDVDLEIGGSDQLFNMLAGRALMGSIKNKEKYVLATKLLVDKNGQKAGKTTNNALFLDSSPKDFYGGIMAFSDDLIYLSFELFTDIKLDGLKERIEKNPLFEKKRLAFEIVEKLWGENEAIQAEKDFTMKFQKGVYPKDIEQYVLTKNTSVFEILSDSKLSPSKSETKRLIEQKAIEKNGKIVEFDETILIEELPLTLKVGKKKFLRLVTK